MMKSKVFFAAFLGLLASACVSTDSKALADGTPVWLLQQAQVDGQNLPVGNEKITLSFNEEGKISGRSAVNYYNGVISLNEGNITWQRPIFSTQMAGDLHAMELEKNYFGALTRSTHVKRSGSRLTLSGDNVTLRYRLQKSSSF